MTDLETIIKRLEELIDWQRLQARLNLVQFLDWAVKQGVARKDLAAYTLSLDAGETLTLTVTNPEHYIWIPHVEFFQAEAANVIAVSTQRDGKTFLDVSALPSSFELNWNTAVPWFSIGVVESVAVATFTNNDVVARWLFGGYFGTYLRDTEYMDFRREMNLNYPREWKKYGKW